MKSKIHKNNVQIYEKKPQIFCEITVLNLHKKTLTVKFIKSQMCREKVLWDI